MLTYFFLLTFYMKRPIISVLVDLFFLINLFFSYWLLHEVALNPNFSDQNQLLYLCVTLRWPYSNAYKQYTPQKFGHFHKVGCPQRFIKCHLPCRFWKYIRHLYICLDPGDPTRFFACVPLNLLNKFRKKCFMNFFGQQTSRTCPNFWGVNS